MFLSAVLAEIVPSMAVLCCITDWKLGMIPHLHSTLSSVADIEKYCESQWRTATQGLDAVQDKGHEMNKRLVAWRPSCCACHCHIQHVYQTLHTHTHCSEIHYMRFRNAGKLPIQSRHSFLQHRHKMAQVGTVAANGAMKPPQSGHVRCQAHWVSNRTCRWWPSWQAFARPCCFDKRPGPQWKRES